MAVPLLQTTNIKGAEIRSYIMRKNAEYVNTKTPWKINWFLYKERHLMECLFNKIKPFGRISSRYDKLAVFFLSFVYIAPIAVLIK